MTPEWIEWLKAKIRKVAEEKRIKVAFDFDHHEVVDHLPPETHFRANRTRDAWLEKLRRYFPGYCPQSIYRFKVDAEGNAYPCCVGVGDRLKLGNVYELDFEHVWNGPTNQDLRRAMLTQDLPAVCQSCNFRTGPILPELPQLPVCDAHFIWMESHPERWTIGMTGPDHLSRHVAAPTFSWTAPSTPVDRYEVVLSAGGQDVDYVLQIPPDVTSFTLPLETWNLLSNHVGYWWTVWGIVDADRRLSWRGKTARCVIRHQDIRRLAASTLDYEATH